MKFRSANGIYLPVPLAYERFWDDTAAVGSFFYGVQQVDWWNAGFDESPGPPYDPWIGRTLWVRMPYDRPQHAHSWHCFRIVLAGEPPAPKPFWTWDGNVERPTLTPSIACGQPRGSAWHGYLTAGMIRACE